MMGKVDRPRLCRLHYKTIVVDEGHRLKNSECKLAAEMRLYKSDSRLLLTGKCADEGVVIVALSSGSISS